MNFRQIVENTLQNNLKPLTPVLDSNQEWYHTQYKVYGDDSGRMSTFRFTRIERMNPAGEIDEYTIKQLLSGGADIEVLYDGTKFDDMLKVLNQTLEEKGYVGKKFTLEVMRAQNIMGVFYLFFQDDGDSPPTLTFQCEVDVDSYKASAHASEELHGF